MGLDRCLMPLPHPIELASCIVPGFASFPSRSLVTRAENPRYGVRPHVHSSGISIKVTWFRNELSDAMILTFNLVR